MYTWAKTLNDEMCANKLSTLHIVDYSAVTGQRYDGNKGSVQMCISNCCEYVDMWICNQHTLEINWTTLSLNFLWTKNKLLTGMCDFTYTDIMIQLTAHDTNPPASCHFQK